MSKLTDPLSVDGLRKIQKDFFDAVIKRYEDGEWWRFAINLALVVGGGVIASIGRLGGLPEPHQTWITAIGLIMVFAGGVLVAVFDRRRTELTATARAAIEASQQFLDQRRAMEERIGAAEALDGRRRYLLQAQQVMLEAVERMPLETDIITVIDSMLDAGSNDLAGAIGFESGEKWTFSIFRRETDKPGSPSEVMRRVAFAWADRSMEKQKGREWRKKEGFTGVSWQRDDEVIEVDVTLPGVTEHYPIPTSKQKLDDSQRYISAAVIPIRVGRKDEMWGSVTATSDRSGRWQRAPSNPREQNVLAVRLLAQLIAMQVALRQSVAVRTL